MYPQSYEDYMRSVLGYSMENSNYMPNTYEGYSSGRTEIVNNNTPCDCRLEEIYPEIYHVVNPMVCKVCRENTRTITKEVIEEMTETIYRTVEPNMEEENRSNTKEPELKNGDVRNPNTKNIESKTEDRRRRPNNYLLRDLIKILIINQLIGGGRPPFPGPGPRPPFPGRPPMNPYPGGPGPIPGPVPPRPRDYNDMVMF